MSRIRLRPGSAGLLIAAVLAGAVGLVTGTPARAHGDPLRQVELPVLPPLIPPLPNGPSIGLPTVPLPSPGALLDPLLRSITGGLLSGPPGGAAPAPALPPPPVTLFESGQTRPLALSADGRHLFALNTPDGRLEVFAVRDTGLVPLSSVPVGVDPVALAVRSAQEVWVVNHVSDSVSVVQFNPALSQGQVVRTLWVGDEPRDIVFAGPSRSRAFITTAHRGQNSPVDPQLTTEGVGRADVWVFDAASAASGAAGAPLTILTLFTNAPRALAVSPNGERVYAAGFLSDNATSTVFQPIVLLKTAEGRGVPGPLTNHQGIPRPEVGVLAKFDGSHWLDIDGKRWDDAMPFTLPDRDVFAIDAMASPPVPVAGAGSSFAHVGTVIFNMAVNPQSGALYVSNLDAHNMTQFEGPGKFAGSTVRGRIADSRITVIKDGQVQPRHLNKHIDYSRCCAALPNAENARSLAFPVDMAVSADGKRLYVAALGSSKIGVFDTARLEADSFVPSTAAQIEVPGGGPSGVVLDEARNRLYVLSRFDNSVAVLDLSSKTAVQRLPMHNPEPPTITRGRRILYDARGTSSRGDSACFSCHMYGDFDGLAWDLGNPDADVAINPGPYAAPGGISATPPPGVGLIFHPMKGPMATQSLRGMTNHGPLHWRGDRTRGDEEQSAQPHAGSYDEHGAFMEFNGAFPDLIGLPARLSDADMKAFTDYAMQLVYPPNPIRRLDNALTPAQQSGRDFYFRQQSFLGASCNECHVLDTRGNEGHTDRPGFFGAEGAAAVADPEINQIKIPHLRNMYQKVGRFGLASNPLLPGSDGHQGEQVKGFGFLHDGGIDTLFSFMSNRLFTFPSDQVRRDIEDFQLAFDNNIAPIVGQQITLQAGAPASVRTRIALLLARADAGECEVVVKSLRNGEELGYVHAGQGQFVGDRVQAAVLSDAQLQATATMLGGNRRLTYTCVPTGSGVRLGIDRDQDGHRDGDERAAGSDPADPLSRPETS